MIDITISECTAVFNIHHESRLKCFSTKLIVEEDLQIWISVCSKYISDSNESNDSMIQVIRYKMLETDGDTESPR